MADRGPNYAIERRRLELAIEEHTDTIERGRARLAEIDRATKRNLSRAELANAELEDEADKVRDNELALKGKIDEINVNLKAMTKGGSDG